ncbi:MAG: 3-oxoacyl-ACP reductase FabG [Pseudomonadota bacterium]|nr:3-oxoacyl-ACP reductase FabG [Pseudomonadota bacterium]
MRLQNRLAIVTGAGRGISKAIAAAMAAEGARVVVADRDEAGARQTASELKATPMPVDIGDPRSVETLFAAVVEQFGRIDILVNNAGVGITRLVVDTALEDWERVLRINLTGSFLCCQQAGRQMMRQKGGRIVNIASLSGQRGGVGRGAYGASKAGVEVLTRILAVELADYGINVNAIAPGPIMTEVAREMHTAETRDAYHRLTPQRRYGEPREIAAAAVFLASEESTYITGHTLNVDGGFQAAGLMFEFDPEKSRSLGSAGE